MAVLAEGEGPVRSVHKLKDAVGEVAVWLGSEKNVACAVDSKQISTAGTVIGVIEVQPANRANLIIDDGCRG